MGPASLFCAHTAGLLGAWSPPRFQTVILIIGLTVLTLGVLFLVFTRWGQAKALHKCVALSVLAHVLLLAYACGIQLMFDAPVAPRETVIRLNMDVSVEPPESEPAPAPKPPPWESLPAETPVEPVPDVPERQVLEGAPLARDASAPPEMPLDSPPLLEPPPVAEPPLPAATLVDAPPLDDRTPAPAAPPEATLPAATIAEQTPVEPPTAEPARLPVAAEDSVPMRSVSMTESTDTPDTPDADADEMQRLMELAQPVDDAEAMADDEDMTAATREPSARAESADDAATGGAAGPPLPIDSNAAVVGAAAIPALIALRRSGDGEQLPAAFQGRMAENREAVLAQNGGNAQTEGAVEAALKWLAAHQEADGHWDSSRHGGGREDRVLGHDRGGAGAEADMAITGLALLAFLGAGHTHLDGQHRETVQHGLEFLVRSQAADGNLAGKAELFARMYSHGMATLAIGEAFAMTGDQRLRPYLERALGYTLRAQHPTSGGWRYQPGDDGDTSQFGWQLMALRSGELAGLPISGTARAGMIRFLNSVAGGTRRGLASYRPRMAPTRTMTAEALVCRNFLGLPPPDGATNEAVAFIMQETPDIGPINLYYWYYATLALFQTQGEAWEQWNTLLQARLLAAQETTGTLNGSWPTDTVWGGYGGRAYTTAMAALCLEVYYRHLPVYGQRP